MTQPPDRRSDTRGSIQTHLGHLLALVENTLAALSLAIGVAIAITQVMLRFLFNSGLVWAHEAIIYSIIFSSFMGAVIALRNNEHVGVDVFAYVLKEYGKRMLAALGTGVVVAYCSVLGIYAWIMVTEPAAHTIQTPTLHLPLWAVQLSVPLGLTLMLIRATEALVRSTRSLLRGGTSERRGEKAGG